MTTSSPSFFSGRARERERVMRASYRVRCPYYKVKGVSREGQPRSKVLLGDIDVCLKDPGNEVVPG